MILPHIPDSFHKTIFAIGIALIVFGYYKYDKTYELTLEKIEKLNELEKDEYFQLSKLVHLENNFHKLCVIESIRLNFELPCKRDSNGDLQFHKLIGAQGELLAAVDSLSIQWAEIENEREELKRIEDRVTFYFDEFVDFGNVIRDQNHLTIFFFSLGSILVLFGAIRWFRIQNIQDNQLKMIHSLETKNEYCQSCARNFSFRVEYGKNKDESKSELFCSDCYDDGEFTTYMSDEKLNEIKNQLLDKAKSKKERRSIEKRFVSLKRWNMDDYGTKE
jgi:hypothetical protein